MKTKTKIGVLFGALLLSMTTTGCHFPSFVPAELEDIEVVVTPFKSFVKDDKFEDCADLKLIGYYSNGTSKYVDKKDAEIIFINDDTNIGYDINKAIPSEGSYSLRARIGNIASSETYSFYAIQSHVYAESIELENNDDYITIAPGTTKTISLSVYPETYSERIAYTIGNESIVRVVSSNNGIFEIESLKAGTSSIVFYAISDPKQNRIEREFKIISEVVYVEDIVVIQPDETFEDEDGHIYTYVTLDVTPSNFTVDISLDYCTDEGLYYEWISKDVLLAYPDSVFGAVTMYFEALTGPGEYGYFEGTISFEVGYPRYIDCFSSPSEIKVGETSIIHVYIDPDSRTYIPRLYQMDENILSINTRSGYTYTVTGLKGGKTDVVFCVETDDEGRLIYCTETITVLDGYADSITASGINCIHVGTTGIIETTIEPSYFIGKTYAVSNRSKIASVTKIDDTTFRVKGLAEGTAEISLFAQSDDNEYIETKYYVTVLPKRTSKTAIKQVCYNRGTKERWPCLPNKGNPKILVLPIWFSNSSYFFKARTLIDTPIPIPGPIDVPLSSTYLPTQLPEVAINQMRIRRCAETVFFGQENKDTGWQSVASYYEKESFGAVHISGTVANWYYSGVSYQNFVTGSVELYDLVSKATEEYFENSGESRKDYDSDGDGYIDAISAVLGIPDYKCFSYGDDNYVKAWAHASGFGRLSEKNTEKPGINVLTSLPFTSIGGSYSSLKGFGANDAKPYSGTAIHEIGHNFGLRDYYDDSGESNFTGSYNMQTNNHGGHDPFSIMSIGWANPIIPSKGGYITINDFQSSHDFILLTPKWNNLNSPFDEYLILELISPTGLNDSSGFINNVGVGIRLWHVNAMLYDSNTKSLTSDIKKTGTLAFNNCLGTEGRFGTLFCPAYQLNRNYQDYGLLHLIRKDDNAGNTYKYRGTDNPILYDSKNGLKNDNLFLQGDKFDIYTYRRQFVNYYLKQKAIINMILASNSTDMIYDLMNIDQLIQTADESLVNYTPTLDFGQEIGWEFRVTQIYDNKNGTYSATIWLNKTI